MDKDFYTPQEVAEKYGLRLSVVMKWIERNKVDYILEEGQYKIFKDQSNGPQGNEFWDKVGMLSQSFGQLEEAE
jgi:hypothetical protein